MFGSSTPRSVVRSLQHVIFMLMAGIFVVPAVALAQATPESAAGNCVEALGIGMPGDSCINIVHASPDAPAVDVYLDGALALEGLEFAHYSGWVAVPAGEHEVQVTATGTAPETAVINATVPFEAGVGYQVAATGLLENINPAIYPVDFGALDAESARVRVIHTSPDAPAVDVAVTGGDVLVANLAFPDASDALDVPAGSYDLEVRPAGTTDVVLPLPGVMLEAGMVYDVFAIGTVSDETLTVLVIPSTSTGGTATPQA